MIHGTIETKVREIAIKCAVKNMVEFVHLEIAGTKRNPTFRVFIDKAGGVTIDDCSIVSGKIEDALDAVDFIQGPYILEVSSPGLDRELYGLSDFEKFKGALAKVKMKPEFEGPRSLNGRITDVDGDTIHFEDRSVGELTFQYESVAKANLKVDLQEEFKRG